MKNVLKVIAIILCAFSLQFFSCSKKRDPQPITDIQLAKLGTSWKATKVTSDGVQQDGYASFILMFSGSPGSKSFNYTANGRPFVSPWKDTGSLTFDATNPAEVLHRDDEVDVEYTVTGTILTLQFNFTGPGYVSGRTSALTGEWTFEFQKQ